jgi:hypothetical protein
MDFTEKFKQTVKRSNIHAFKVTYYVIVQKNTYETYSLIDRNKHPKFW